MMLVSGFFTNQDNFAPYLIPLKYLSILKYPYQMLIINEFENLAPLNCVNLADCNPIRDYHFNESFETCVGAFIALIVVLRLFALLFLYLFVKIKV